ncbi:MAG: hypothetical protein COT43_01610 [Candidatus Marinimicrobia bacterium CG08_land_8_20_14_0_20_45_22]|nr:MAG: hypothetical protein COT43_01610 [Candidatus Marinimicrobia bacterium CG08_land_8_20_14_0_20_45_22]
MERDRLYFAYADNMNEELIRSICPGAEFEGVAELREYRLDFNEKGQPVVIMDCQHSVWGIVWCLSVRDIALLDEKETRKFGKHSKVKLPVWIEGNRDVDAFICLPNETGTPIYRVSCINDIVEQADYWSLPRSYVSYIKSLKGLEK